MTIIAELALDFAESGDAVPVRLFAPEKRERSWVCRYEIGDRIDHGLDVHGESSLQALALAMKALSAALYGSAAYRNGKLGLYGQFGGYLGIPAPNVFLDEAPYPF
ncbi:DUF6968 family protein [Phenylobacterium zucineum]|uniref:DUF6968 family protein n=1 Tax=Phenylobacterium zucineum TaxID=284016 RepID=UPI0011D12157|nr:hypothetical protein [Phenylobacterium zucineum]